MHTLFCAANNRAYQTIAASKVMSDFVPNSVVDDASNELVEKEESGSESGGSENSDYYLFSDGAYDILNSYTEEDGPFKLILCVNNSLSMGKGKVAAQCCHATLGAYKIAIKYCQTAVENWEDDGQAKVAVKVDTEAEMADLQAKAMAAGLVSYFVQDEGRTQIAAGSRTVLAIGPAPAYAFQGLTSHLKLL